MIARLEGEREREVAATTTAAATAIATAAKIRDRISYSNSGHTIAISFTLVPVKPVKMSEFNFLKT